VGHNATLNWEAMQAASWFCDDMKYHCFWSECHVSEDFDRSLRLQSSGCVGRYIMYTSMLAYLFTYVALAWAIIFIPMSIYVSLFSNKEQHMQQTSFEVLCGCLLVFFFIRNICLIILSYCRKRGNSMLLIALEQAKFCPIVSLFFARLLYHVFVGLFRHMFDMFAEWGATTKDRCRFLSVRFGIRARDSGLCTYASFFTPSLEHCCICLGPSG
jgi:uncharacterized membrane-anchored protein YitT (DUF2179 family)